MRRRHNIPTNLKENIMPSKTFPYGNHQVTLETGIIAKLATAAVTVTWGDTVVLVSVVA